jgi:ABC-type Zn uptake system ZnuABC Zn-binding protein ZnuA
MKADKRDIVLRRIKFGEVPVEDLTDGELQDIIEKLEVEMEEISSEKKILSSIQLFGYLLLDYAMQLYRIKHFEKAAQKADEKRLDETLKRLENFLKNP